jgi:hypothetical protein
MKMELKNRPMENQIINPYTITLETRLEAWPPTTSGLLHYSNIVAFPHSVRILLADVVKQMRPGEVEVQTEAHDIWGRPMPESCSVYMSKEAKKLYNALLDTPEITAMRAVTEQGLSKTGRLDLDPEGVIPGFFSPKNRARLEALALDYRLKWLHRLPAYDSIRKSEISRVPAQRDAILSPLWHRVTYPTVHDMRVLVERAVGVRLPQVQEAIK